MKDYDFSDYKTFKELFRDIFYRTIKIDEAVKIVKKIFKLNKQKRRKRHKNTNTKSNA